MAVFLAYLFVGKLAFHAFIASGIRQAFTVLQLVAISTSTAIVWERATGAFGGTLVGNVD